MTLLASASPSLDPNTRVAFLKLLSCVPKSFDFGETKKVNDFSQTYQLGYLCFVSKEINYHSGKSCSKYSGGCGGEIKTVG